MSKFVSWIPRIFLLGALIGAIGCLGRPDYNLPIFLFAYIAWNYMRVSANWPEPKTHRDRLVRFVDGYWRFLAYFHQLEDVELGSLPQAGEMGKGNPQLHHHHGHHQLRPQSKSFALCCREFKLAWESLCVIFGWPSARKWDDLAFLRFKICFFSVWEEF